MKVTSLDNQGRGITYLNNKIVFVNNALDGENVDIEVTDEKNKYILANVKKYKTKNKDRIIPKCPYYQECGGCNLMHATIQYQNNFKLDKVKSILRKYAGINQDIKFIPSDKELFYRNKITLKIENGKWGYYNTLSHILTEVNKCLIASNAINDLLTKKDLFNIKNGNIVIRSNFNNELLIEIKTDDKINIEFSSLPNNIAGIVLNDELVFKNNYFYDYIKDIKFKISYNSFFQINNYIAGNIFDILRNNLSGINLLDLYCGVGTLGLSLKNNFENIYGIEVVENAIIDAKDNAKSNNISNAFYFAGDTAKILNKLNVKFDTILLDPPRSGLNKDTMNLVLKLMPLKIGYVSCDPLTLARDLKILKEYYNIDKIYALDMFPNTYHVECVCVLNLK